MIRHNSSIISICHPFQPSPIPLLRVLIFLVMMLQNHNKIVLMPFDWQLLVLNVNGHAYSYPLPPLLQWGLTFALNGIERVILHPENYSFDAIISDYFSGRPLPPSSFTGARGAHKRQQGYIYSYHRVQNSYQLLFDTNAVFYYF
jgi:hypothetical protein